MISMANKILYLEDKIKELYDQKRKIINSLPSEEEIEKMVNDHCQRIVSQDKVMLVYAGLAQKLSKRIRREIE